METWLGIDLGSISAKAVLVDKNKSIVNSIYIRSKDTESSLREILNYLIKGEIKIKGVGVTGSGREFAKNLINADLVKTEIIAHSIGNLHYQPKVRTIIDIGGEDSKLILLQDGIMRDFNMNTVCSAGMGACMENITIRLGIKIEEFGSLALKANKIVNLPMKCGVLMSSAVVSAKNKGERIEDILMGVIKAVARNFISICARGKDLETPIIFCGMTAHNKALHKALQDEIGKNIFIPKSPELMGAFGMALLTAEEMNGKQTSFNNHFVINKNYKIIHNREDCIACGNCFTNASKYFIKDGDGKSRCIKEEIEKEDLENLKMICKNCPKQLIILKGL